MRQFKLYAPAPFITAPGRFNVLGLHNLAELFLNLGILLSNIIFFLNVVFQVKNLYFLTLVFMGVVPNSFPVAQPDGLSAAHTVKFPVQELMLLLPPAQQLR